MVKLGPQMIHWRCRAAQLDPRALYNPATIEEPKPKEKYESFMSGRICTGTGPEYDGCRFGGWGWCTRAELHQWRVDVCVAYRRSKVSWGRRLTRITTRTGTGRRRHTWCWGNPDTMAEEDILMVTETDVDPTGQAWASLLPRVRRSFRRITKNRRSTVTDSDQKPEFE